MKLLELGRRSYQVLLPISLFAGLLIQLKISMPVLILSTIIFTIVYILVWHEIRIKNLEKKWGIKER